MILLRPLTDAEFPAYAAYFVPDYAADLAANSGLTPLQAHAAAAQDLSQSLPQGPQTPGQILLAITNAQDLLQGYLWYELQDNSRRAFCSTFHILPQFQGLGLASQALAAWQSRVQAEGATTLRLRVAPDNPRARHVYAKAGFQVSGITMTKPLP